MGRVLFILASIYHQVQRRIDKCDMKKRLGNVTEHAPGGMKSIARILPVFGVKSVYKIRLRDRSTTHSQ